MIDVYNEITKKMLSICTAEKLLAEPVRVRARVLTTEEAIGNPDADDFPLQKGKERLMQAQFFDSFGQAFTDRYGDFEGILGDVFQMSLKNNFRRAVFVASLNAVLRHTKGIAGTIHCRDEGPRDCADKMLHYVKEKYGSVKIALVGFQPRMVEYLAGEFPLRVLDLDPDNIGTRKFEVMIEGQENTQDAVAWADLLLVTGTTLVNNTIGHFLNGKPLIFYGTTVAGAAHLMNWERFCASST